MRRCVWRVFLRLGVGALVEPMRKVCVSECTVGGVPGSCGSYFVTGSLLTSINSHNKRYDRADGHATTIT